MQNELDFGGPSYHLRDAVQWYLDRLDDARDTEATPEWTDRAQEQLDLAEADLREAVEQAQTPHSPIDTRS